MTLQLRRDGDQIIVYGKTYDHRAFIKSLGGRFDGDGKVWLVPFNEQNLARLSSVAAGEIVMPTPTTTIPGDTDAGLRVSELIGRAQAAITASFSVPVWVIGEIHNITEKKSGWFFSLGEAKDATAEVASVEVKTILWRSAFNNLEEKYGHDALAAVLRDGLQARMLCHVSLYRDRAQLSLNVIDIDPAYTKGALALAREALLRELRNKGLDRQNKQLPLPRFPFRVGLISATASRAYSDFTDQLWAYGFPGTLIFAATATQGETVPASVSTAIKQLAAAGCDVIVLTRGGGSAADLRWFDAKDIAYAIAECPVPIITAIGHHDDVSVAELLSHAHEKTPTAAADFINNIFQQTREHIKNHSLSLAQTLLRSTNEATRLQEQLGLRLRQAAHLYLSQTERTLLQATTTLTTIMRDTHMRLQRQVDDLSNVLRQGFTKFVHAKDLQLTQLLAGLTRIDPRPWLQAGWTQLTFKRQPITSVHQLAIDDDVQARLLDGKLTLKVTTKTQGEPHAQ